MPDDFDPRDHREGSGALRWIVLAFVLAVVVGLWLAGCTPSYKPLPPLTASLRIVPAADIEAVKGPHAYAYTDLRTRTIYLPSEGSEDPYWMCVARHEISHVAYGLWHPVEDRNNPASFTTTCGPVE